ncbi:MAG TPA: hypothetical protein PLH57_02705 [Oligoflexia bacterium]|nr:hypothetical protein [Oligoflexia bacterium]
MRGSFYHFNLVKAVLGVVTLWATLFCAIRAEAAKDYPGNDAYLPSSWTCRTLLNERLDALTRNPRIEPALRMRWQNSPDTFALVEAYANKAVVEAIQFGAQLFERPYERIASDRIVVSWNAPMAARFGPDLRHLELFTAEENNYWFDRFEAKAYRVPRGGRGALAHRIGYRALPTPESKKVFIFEVRIKKIDRHVAYRLFRDFAYSLHDQVLVPRPTLYKDEFFGDLAENRIWIVLHARGKELRRQFAYWGDLLSELPNIINVQYHSMTVEHLENLVRERVMMGDENSGIPSGDATNDHRTDSEVRFSLLELDETPQARKESADRMRTISEYEIRVSLIELD